MQDDRISYDALNKINEAIRLYVSKQSDGLFYDNQSFQGAVARDLYYRLLNHSFLKSLSDQASVKLDRAPKLWEKSFLNIAGMPVDKGSVANITFIDRSLESTFVRSLRSFLFLNVLKLKRNSYEAPKAALAIHVIHPKFVRYLKPILKKYGSSFYFLISYPNKSLTDLLDEEGFPYVYCGPFADRKILKPGRGLYHWSHLLLMYEIIRSAVKALEPSRVLVVEGNAPQDEIVRLAATACGVSTVCLQQGWSPYSHPGFENMSYAKFLTWGDGFSEILREKNSDQCFIATGNHMVSSSIQSSSASNRRRALSFFLQAPTHVIGSWGWNQMLVLIERLCLRHPDQAVLVREHPSCPLKKDERRSFAQYKNLRVIDPRETTLADQLDQSWMSVSIYSTVIFESIASFVPVYIANFSSLPGLSPDVEAYGAGKLETDLSRMLEDFSVFIQEPDRLDSFIPGMKVFKEKFFKSESDEAVSKVIEEILL